MKDGATEALFLVCKMKLNFPNLYFLYKKYVSSEVERFSTT